MGTTTRSQNGSTRAEAHSITHRRILGITPLRASQIRLIFRVRFLLPLATAAAHLAPRSATPDVHSARPTTSRIKRLESVEFGLVTGAARRVPPGNYDGNQWRYEREID